VTRNWFVASALAFAVGIAIPTTARAFSASPDADGQQDYGQQGYGQQGGWDAAPQEYNDVQRRGFHDGIQGAQRDYGNNRRPDVNNREEYRDPDDMPRDIPPQMRDAYRDAFRRGYAVAASHLWGTPLPSWAQPQQPNWDSWGMRGLQSDAQRQGYREGMEEARKDFQFHRRTDPDDHEEYRNPYVAPQFVDEYREGFMRGYTVAMSQLNGDPSWQQYSGDPGQWQAPGAYSDMARRGFHDGVEGARRDFGNHRRPDPNNRDEYRNPNVPDQFRGDYRQGFRRGYEMAAARLWGGQ
jgi:hypothetical protein